jgi:hypothetical protein
MAATHPQVLQLREFFTNARARQYHNEGPEYAAEHRAYTIACITMGILDPLPITDRISMDMLFDEMFAAINEIEWFANTGLYEEATRRTHVAARMYRDWTESYWGHMHSDIARFLRTFRFRELPF